MICINFLLNVKNSHEMQVLFGVTEHILYTISKKESAKMNIGKFLKKLREERNLSVREVALAVEIGASTLNEYENGLIDPPTSKFLLLCDFYNVSPFCVLGDRTLLDYTDYSNESRKRLFALIEYEKKQKLKKYIKD
jgi:transcriptional regulator with XRE-family HTH domain